MRILLAITIFGITLFANSHRLVAQENVLQMYSIDSMLPGLTASTNTVTIPLHDEGGGQQSIYATLMQRTFDGKTTFEVSEIGNILDTVNFEYAETLVLAYLDATREDRLNELDQFYLTGAELSPFALQSAKMSQQFFKMHGDVQQLSLNRVLFFGPFQVVTVGLEFSTGDKKTNSVSVKKSGDRYYRQDNWAEWQPVQQLLWYLNSILDKGMDPGHRYLDLKYSVVLGDGDTAMKLAFDGVNYGLETSWQKIPRRPSTDNAEYKSETGAGIKSENEDEIQTGIVPDNVANFVHQAMETAQAENLGALLMLWSEEERQAVRSNTTAANQAAMPEHISEYDSGSNMLITTAQQVLGSVTEFKDVMTIKFADYAIHYFAERSDPSILRAIAVDISNGRYALTGQFSRGKNFMVYQFFTSEVFKQALAQRYLANSDVDEKSAASETNSE